MTFRFRFSLPCMLLLLAPVWACGPQPPGSEGELQLGTGEQEFIDVHESGEIELVYGPQGGWHVWVSLVADGLDPDRVEMELTTETLGVAGTRDRSIVYMSLEPMPDGRAVRYGWRAILSHPECADGRPLKVEVRLRDRGDTVAEDAFVAEAVALENVSRLGECRQDAPAPPG